MPDDEGNDERIIQCYRVHVNRGGLGGDLYEGEFAEATTGVRVGGLADSE